MFGLFDLSSFRGIGMIVLQVLRGLTIIGLGTGIASCVILIAKVDTGKDYWFFDAVSSSFTVLIAIFLIITELPVLKRWIRNNWPSFSDMHGVGWLGLALIVIGCNILGLASSDLLGKATSPNVLASFQLQKYKSKIAKTLKKTKTPKKKNNHPK
jgi:hypothetical protein